MTLTATFIVALVLSFIGSMPTGLITLSIIQRTVEKGIKSGLMVSLGAVIPEFIYTAVALFMMQALAGDIPYNRWIQGGSAALFLFLGIYYFVKKPVQRTAVGPHIYRDFVRGVVVGFLNMLIVPYWVFVVAWLQGNGYPLEAKGSIWIFSAGAALGAWMVFVLYTYGSQYLADRIGAVRQYTNKGVGAIFLGLALLQIVKMV